MNNFSINPNFNTQAFNNSIDEFNKAFSSTSNEVDNTIDAGVSFEDVFNNKINSTPQQNSYNPVQYVGMDSINAQKIENVSPVAKMAQDIQNGFSDGLKGLNAIERQAEVDFETFASGGDISIHDVMISSQKSALAMQMAIQLRNQMLSAYNEFKNMTF